MAQPDRERERSFSRRLMWFVGLWLLGVAGAIVLALPFRLLIAAAMHYQR
ncbi:hypothetical protein AAGS40_07405 [Paraburkholderia sp. PREW-6R]